MEGEKLLRGKEADVGKVKLHYEDVIVTAANQYVHDGLMILQEHSTGTRLMILCLLRQQKVEQMNRMTGGPTLSTINTMA
jgi:hypothetical protein